MRGAHFLAVLVLFFSAQAWAVDHNNLDEGRPLRIEDAYPIAYGELSAEIGAGLQHQSRSPDQGLFTVEFLYGAYWNLHLGVGSTLATDPRAIDDSEKSGDLHAFALYNLNQETLRLPALAAKLALEFPTGARSRGVDTTLTGIITRSYGQLRTHLNAGYTFVGAANDTQRHGRYTFVLGAQYPLGFPHFFHTTLLADLFTEQSDHNNERNPSGIEVGFRRQFASLIVADIGVGTELVGPTKRAPFFCTFGLSVGF